MELIAGVDEAGRGPLFGPVVACAVIFSEDIEIDGITDSKKLSPKKRQKFFKIIKAKATSIGIGMVHEDRIDEINILKATMEAMNIAVDDLSVSPDFLLVDGNIKPLTKIDQESIVKGDCKSLSIAAASIIAKVTRDQMMAQYDMIYPGYGLSRNMGYGTREHMQAIKTQFSTPIHRRSFSPVSDFLPRFKDIDDINRLSTQVVATDILKKGHKIHFVLGDNLETINIISSYKNEYYSYSIDEGKDNDALKSRVQIEGKELINQINAKKDITSSLNIAVISVEFSKGKPKINYKNL